MDGPATATALAAAPRHEHRRDQLSPAQARLGRPGRGDRATVAAGSGWWRAATEMHECTRARRGRRSGRPRPPATGCGATTCARFVERYEAWLDAQAGMAARLAGRRRRERLRASTVSPARLAAFNDEMSGADRALSPRSASEDDAADERGRPGPPATRSRSRVSDAMTALDARSARRRYLILIALRWLPTGLLIPVTVLLALSRGLSLTEIGLVFSIQGLVVLALELPTGGLTDALGRRPMPDPRQPRRRSPRWGSSTSPTRWRCSPPSIGAPGRLPGSRQRAARGVVRGRDAGRRPEGRDRARPQRRQHGPEPRHRMRRAAVGRARRAGSVRRRSRRWRSRSSWRSPSAS